MLELWLTIGMVAILLEWWLNYWMEYLEDYDFTLHYHPGKANVVVDALSRKSRGVLANVASREWQMLEVVGLFELTIGMVAILLEWWLNY